MEVKPGSDDEAFEFRVLVSIHFRYLLGVTFSGPTGCWRSAGPPAVPDCCAA